MGTSLAVTGHRELPEPAQALKDGIAAVLDARKFDVVWSMLAEGADRLVVDLALKRGMVIAAVIPFDDYELDFKGSSRLRYRAQLEKCGEVIQLSRPRSDRGYLEAGKIIVDHARVLIAIWDGSPAEGSGGTAQIVSYAQQGGCEIVRVDPKAGWVRSSGPHSDTSRQR